MPTDAASWATPSSRDWKDSPEMATEGVNPDGSHRERDDRLPRQAHLFTPGATGVPCAGPTALSDSSPVKPWQTPSEFNGEKRRQVGQTERAELLLPGEVKAFSHPKAKAAYNPRFGLALMGLPADWLDAPVFEASRGPRRRRKTPSAPEGESDAA